MHLHPRLPKLAPLFPFPCRVAGRALDTLDGAFEAVLQFLEQVLAPGGLGDGPLTLAALRALARWVNQNPQNQNPQNRNPHNLQLPKGPQFLEQALAPGGLGDGPLALAALRALARWANGELSVACR